MAERITYLTEDGVRIVGSYRPGQGERGVVLLHMMPSTKESWDELAERLVQEGFDVLAIDLRGHGESVELRGGGGTLDWKSMSDEEHQASRYDVSAAVEWFVKAGIERESVELGGASIGANLAVEYASEHLECPGCFLLSPGLDYRGIHADECAERLAATQRIFIAAAKNDKRNGGLASDQAQTIYEAAASEKMIRIFDTGGHGTELLEAHKDFPEELVSWLLADVRD